MDVGYGGAGPAWDMPELQGADEGDDDAAEVKPPVTVVPPLLARLFSGSDKPHSMSALAHATSQGDQVTFSKKPQ